MDENKRYDVVGRLVRAISLLVEQGGPWKEVHSAIKAHEDYDSGNMEEFLAWWPDEDAED